MSATQSKEGRLSIRVNPQELEEMKRYAEERGMSFTDFVVRSIRQSMGVAEINPDDYLNLARRVAALEERLGQEKNQAA